MSEKGDNLEADQILVLQPTFGEYLKLNRTKAGTTPSQLAETIGRSPSYIRGIERGAQNASATGALWIAKVFDPHAVLHGKTLYWDEYVFEFQVTKHGQNTSRTSVSKAEEVIGIRDSLLGEIHHHWFQQHQEWVRATCMCGNFVAHGSLEQQMAEYDIHMANAMADTMIKRE